MQIPVENIYYLLCYAWNKLEEKERISVSVDDKTRLQDLFAKILVNAVVLLLKRGVDRGYQIYVDELPGVKGKLELAQTLKSGALARGKTICGFDELTVDTMINRILYTTMYRLSRTEGVDRNLKFELQKLLWMFGDLPLLEITHGHFNRVRLNRNNRFYGLILDVCRIVFESSLPSEEPGAYTFMDFTRDDNRMAMLFESFVRNFYRRERPDYPTVGRENIQWGMTSPEKEHLDFLPQMQTDITLENRFRKFIIDAKFYREAMTVNYRKERVRSGNLYQLFSYLVNQETDEVKTRHATGILLYPTVSGEYNLDFRYKEHAILIRTVDLNTGWKNIERRLHEIID